MAAKKLKINWDFLGAGASFACALHCAVLPLALASLPVFGVDILRDSRFENGMIFIAFGIGSIALWHGYRKHHRRLAPFLLFAFGMLFLLAKQYWRNYELRLLPFAAGCMIAAHLVNLRFSRVYGKSRENSGLTT